MKLGLSNTKSARLLSSAAAAAAVDQGPIPLGDAMPRLDPMEVIRRRYAENEKTSLSPDAATVPPPGGVAFWVGTGLILLSFGIYPAYPLVHLLPISLWQKGGVGLALAAVSWGIFLVGSALVGKKGVAYLKRRLFSQRASA